MDAALDHRCRRTRDRDDEQVVTGGMENSHTEQQINFSRIYASIEDFGHDPTHLSAFELSLEFQCSISHLQRPSLAIFSTLDTPIKDLECSSNGNYALAISYSGACGLNYVCFETCKR